MNEKVTKELQSYTLNKAFFFYAIKKTERLTRAIYLITNFFSESEPLRWKLREENLSLLEYFSRVLEPNASTSSVDLSFIKRSLEMSLASLGIAHTAGLISEMNYAIMKNEYESLLNALSRERESDGNHSPLLFPKDFFTVESEIDSGASRERYLYNSTFGRGSTGFETTRKEQVEEEKEQSRVAREPVTSGPESRGTVSSKGQEEDIKDIKDIKKTGTAPKASSATDFSRTNRREVILQLIKNKKEITVKDAAREIHDCSEKTLQRELVGLVGEGVLERVGSRRWSRYRFV